MQDLLFVICYLLFVICYLLFVICYLLFVICYLLFVICCLLFVIAVNCQLLYIDWHIFTLLNNNISKQKMQDFLN